MNPRFWQGLALGLSACSFPEAFVCTSDTQCAEGWRCEARTSRCTRAAGVGASDSGRTEDRGGAAGADDLRTAPDAPMDSALPDARMDSALPDARLDSALPDAAVPDLGPKGMFCASLCPNPGPCKALVPVGDPSFELDDGSWAFRAPAGRALAAEDFQLPSDGTYMADVRVDFALAPLLAFSRVEQFLPFRELPAGRYRLCFDWRVVSGLGNTCVGAVAVQQSALLMSRNPEDPAEAPATAVAWTIADVEGWCAAATLGATFRATPWAEACVEFERPSGWLDPGLGFLATRAGVLTPENWHRFLVDSVRLEALDCSTWR